MCECAVHFQSICGLFAADYEGRAINSRKGRGRAGTTPGSNCASMGARIFCEFETLGSSYQDSTLPVTALTRTLVLTSGLPTILPETVFRVSFEQRR